jgi:hypothetical protein
MTTRHATHRLPAALLGAAVIHACSPPLEPTVVVVVLDGARWQDTFGDDPSTMTGLVPSVLMPRAWQELVPEAARATSAYNLGATITAPAHAAMMTGRRTSFGNYEVPDAGPGAYRPEIPTLPEVVVARGWRSVVLANTDLLSPLTGSVFPGAARAEQQLETDDAGEPAQDDAALLDTALALLDGPDPPRLLLVNLHQIDRSGHFGAPEDYGEDLAAIDGPLADFWKRLSRGRSSAVHLFVLADHGRHVEDDADPPWKNHGDACAGCRHVPLLVLGPGARAGVSVDDVVTVADVGPTAAALLGLELPYADGRVARELFDVALPASPTGVADQVGFGGHTARLERRDTAHERAVLWLDDVMLSEPGATAIDGLTTLADGGLAWACWRELAVVDGAADLWWVPRCAHHDGASWSRVAAPEPVVGPFWSMTMSTTPSGPVAAYVHNPNAIVREGLAGDELGVRQTAWDGDRWAPHAEVTLDAAFPDGLAVVHTGGAPFLVAAASPDVSEGRYRRRLYGGRLGSEGAALAWIQLEVDGWRLERPALREADGTLHLAAIATREDGTALLLTSSEDGGASWGEPVFVPLGAGVMPHLTPVWAGARVVVGAVGDGSWASVCAVDTDGARPTCVEAPGGALLALHADGDSVDAVVAHGDDWSWWRPEPGALAAP